MKKIILVVFIVVTTLSFGQNTQSVRLTDHAVQMRRADVGDNTWKNALVSGYNVNNGFSELYLNYTNSFTRVSIMSNTTVRGALYVNDGINAGATIMNPSFRLGGNDFAMRRSSAGDTTWKRALVPTSTTLHMNYGTDFTNGVRINGKIHMPDNVGIGTQNPDSKLTVKGKIHCEEVKVDLSVPADYVFEKYYTGTSKLKADYVMPTLKEVEAFTKANNHLPEMPSAKEIQENGLLLKEMTNLLLQKIEELTLYTIEQEKRINALEVKLAN